MAWVDIPKGAKQIQINGSWVDIPNGASQYEIPDIQPKNNSNLGIDGNAIPQAPTWSAPQAQDARDRAPLGWGDVASALNPFGGADSIKAQDKIYDGIKKELGGVLDYYQNDGKAGEELEKKNATEALARAKHVSDDRTILAQLFGPDEKKQKVGQAAETMLYNWAKKSGYDDVKEYNGGYYLQKGDKFIPIDEPGIGDTFSTYLNEMGVPMGAITMVSALSPFKKLNMVQKAVAGLTTTAIGSGIGRAMDLNQNAGAIGADVGVENYIKHAVSAANDDLTAGLAIGAAAKGAKTLYEPTKKLAGKAFEIAPTTPILRQIATGNLSGAERRLNKVVGDDLAGMDARNALDENTLKQFINNDRAHELPMADKADTWIKQKYNEAASALNEKAVKPVDQAIRKIVQGNNVNERRADLLLKALGDESGQGVNQIAAALKEDPAAYDKFTKSLLNLTGAQRNEIRTALKDTPEISKVLDEFSGRTKQEFRDMIDTLDNAFAIKLAPESEAIGALKNQIAQDLENPLIKNSAVKPQVLEYLSKPMGLKEWQEARTIINDEMSVLSRYSDVQARYATQALKGVKGLIDEAMDGILDAAGKGVDGWQAKTLLQTARKDYAKFKELEQSDLFKQIASGIKNDAKQAEILSRPDAIGNVNGLNTEEFLSRLGDKDRAAIESGLIKQIVEKYTDKSSKIEISDFRSIINEIDSLPLKTTQAKQIKEMLNKNGGILRNTGELLQTLKKINPKAFEGSQGISPNAAARGETMAANRLLNMAIRAVPFLGDNRALKYNIAQAIKNSGDLKLISQKIDAIPTHNLPSETKKALDEFKKNLAGLSEAVEKTGAVSAKQENKTVVRGNNIQIIENLDEAGIRDIVANKKRVAVDTLDKETADKMGFKYTDVKRTIYADEITHALKQHGNEAKEAARGQKAITAKDIANYHKFAKNADKSVIVDGERGQKVLISGKQINGHYVIVEEAQTKNNNLAFKTMYFKKGDISNNKIFQSAPMAKDSQGLAFSPYKDDAQRVAQTSKRIIPQNSAKDELEIKTYANPHVGTGLVAGSLNSIDEDGNFSPERFAAGFLAGLVGGKAVATGLRKMTPKLYNQILGAAEKMPQMANGNPKLLGKLYANGKDVSLNSFAGEKAITANVGKLDQAKAMLEKGADEVEIWQKTGWFKDEIDDKWKFEINPRGGELKPNPPRNTVLYNVLNDEKLYEAYPELQLYKVEVAGEYNPMALKALGSADGGFIPSQKTFIINEKTTDFKSTLYHEIQHAIQEIEGFSPGASSKNGKYWLAGGEVEARNVQKRMNDVSYDGFKNSTSMEFFPYKEEAQLQRMAGDKEYMEYHKLSNKYSDYLNDKGDGFSAQEEARVMELFEKLKGRLGFTEDDYKKGYELYLKENAEYQKHPLHTLDAPRGERVNIGRGDLNLSRELERDFLSKDRINLNALSEYDQIVNIGKDKAGKEKISSFVNKLKQDELGKLLQKTITNKDLSTKTKIEIIEAAKKRFAKETPKSLNRRSEVQMIVKAKKDDKKQK